MLTYVSSIVFSVHTDSLNSASDHTNLSSLASANKTLQFIGEGRGTESTSYQTLLSSSGCFSTCSAFQRNIAETSCAHSIFKEFFTSSLVNPPLCWLVYQQATVQLVTLHPACEGNAQLRLVFKQDWGVGGNGALENAFPPATWHGCLGSYLMRKSFPNTAVPVFITALVPLLWWSSFLICFLKHCNDQTLALAVEATLWFQPFLLAACFPVVANTGLSLRNVLLPSDNAGCFITQNGANFLLNRKTLHRSWYLKPQISGEQSPVQMVKLQKEVPGKPVAFFIPKAFRSTADLVLRQGTACVTSWGPIQP